jgi:hypothetical protein
MHAFMSHYCRYAERITVYDNQSTDDTVDVAKSRLSRERRPNYL